MPRRAKKPDGRRAVPTRTHTFRITISQLTQDASQNELPLPIWDVAIPYDETNKTNPFQPVKIDNLVNSSTANGNYNSTGQYNVNLPEIPLDKLRVQVRTYAEPLTSGDGTQFDKDVATAAFEQQVTLSTSNKTATIVISLNSTIDHFNIQPTTDGLPELTSGKTLKLTANPVDAKGNNVFVDPSQLQWKTSDSTVVNVNPATGELTPGYIGASPILHPKTGDKVGAATITITELGFNISNSITAYTRINVGIQDVPLDKVVNEGTYSGAFTLGSKRSFVAIITGLQPTAISSDAADTGLITWSLTNQDGSAIGPLEGNITAGGLYTAPAPTPDQRVPNPDPNNPRQSKPYKITATSVADPHQAATAKFKVQVGSTDITVQ